MLEYACQVWHSNLPQYLSHEIETVQKRAFNAIYPESNCVTALHVARLTTLEDRRYELCKFYFNRILKHDNKLHHLLPDERVIPYALRPYTGEQFLTRTNRYKNSFILWSLANLQSCLFDFTVHLM